MGYVETKWNDAGPDYPGSLQARQDQWLRDNRGIIIDVVMGGQ
jgi:hypothetical protein